MEADAAVWALPGRPTRMIVDLDAIAANVRYFRSLVTPGTGVMAVVKADGYGHGAVMVAREAVAAGVSQLAVATVDEGVALRRADIRAPILILGPVETSELSSAISSHLALTISDSRFVPVVVAAARSIGGSEPVSLHLKVDTGMNRFGVRPDDAVTIARQITLQPELSLDGFCSHFADADGKNEGFAVNQADRFEACVLGLRRAGINPGLVHLSNSAAALRFRSYDHDLVRIGIGLYGLSPSPTMTLPTDLRPALKVQSRVTRLWEIREGETVSYGRTYTAGSRERVGLIPIGYADGYRRGLSNTGVMTLNGVECRVRGRVCMDQTVIGVPESIRGSIGDRVEVMSSNPDAVNSIAGIASRLDTIDYEVVTGLSRRIPRYYTKDRSVVAVQDLHTVGLMVDDS